MPRVPGHPITLEDLLRRDVAKRDKRIAALEAEVARLRAVLASAAPTLAAIAGQLEPYRDEDGWGVGVTTDDIVVWSSLSAVADNLAFALEPKGDGDEMPKV